MEQAPVAIVGESLSGLILALCLAKYRVPSIILERAVEVKQDRRIATITGSQHVSFSTLILANSFLVLSRNEDTSEASSPDGVVHVQHVLGILLQQIADQHAQSCQIRRGCEIESLEEDEDGVTVSYRDDDGMLQELRCSWLIGAEGTGGVVQKHFAEKGSYTTQVQRSYSESGGQVSNHRFSGRTVLMADSALMLFPFAGQAMTSEICDGYGLGWRLVISLQSPSMQSDLRQSFMDAWEREIEQHMNVRRSPIPSVSDLRGDDGGGGTSLQGEATSGTIEAENPRVMPAGFYLTDYGGGGMIAQIYVQSQNKHPVLSDVLFRHSAVAMTLLVIGRDGRASVTAAQDALRAADLPPSALSVESIVSFDPSTEKTPEEGQFETFHPCSTKPIGDILFRKGYDGTTFHQCLEATTSYAIVRPDWVIFAQARDLEELRNVLVELRRWISNDT